MLAVSKTAKRAVRASTVTSRKSVTSIHKQTQLCPTTGTGILPKIRPRNRALSSAPSVTGAHCSRLREIAVQIPRRRAFRRQSSRNRKAPIVNDEDGHSPSSSPSPPPKRDGAAGRELYFDMESSPSCTPEGYLVFGDSSPEREDAKRLLLFHPKRTEAVSSQPRCDERLW
ncbi:hypothetical protein HPB52_024675 [Rhipicephalus sanguineus]|uniref:Uncharacterized protein n=1 Tax=Rhipicephalus sanguineus TaxID=34632 RepID=A0A9D4PAI0_RHISA|nr:hypothetical protein HPB52_024675 [Rhipicephalus sanguineus]